MTRPCTCSPKVLAWLAVKGRKSEATKNTYHLAVHHFVRAMNLTADELLRRPKRDVVDILEKYLNTMVAENRAPKSTHVCMVAIRGFLEHYDKKVEHKFTYDATSRKSSYLGDIVPDSEMLERILSYASSEGKAIIALQAYSGLRPSLIAGLKLGDLRDFDLQKLQATKEPMMIFIPKDRIGNKAKIDFWTFLPKQGIDFLTTHLRKSLRETPTSETRIFKPKHNNIMYHARRAFEEVGFKTRTYVLRSYFSAAIGHLANQTFAKFLMGHKNIEVLYQFERALSQAQIEDYRSQFAGIVQYLIPSAKVDPKRNLIAALMGKGYTEQQASEMVDVSVSLGVLRTKKLAEVTADEIVVESMRQKELKKAEKELKSHHDPQKIVSLAELETCLNEGWFFVSNLGDGRVVVGRFE